MHWTGIKQSTSDKDGNVMAQTNSSKKSEKQASEPPATGRGGARAGAGRKSGSGAFGEATVPMRIPVSMAKQIEAALEQFKDKFTKAREAGDKVGPVDLNGLDGSAMAIAAGAPSGKPVDLAKLLAKRPESCFAWTASLDYPSLGVSSGDVLIVDRSCRATSQSLCAYWGNDGIALAKMGKLPKGMDAWGVAVALVRKLPE